jgi:hypothetical protein
VGDFKLEIKNNFGVVFYELPELPASSHPENYWIIFVCRFYGLVFEGGLLHLMISVENIKCN